MNNKIREITEKLRDLPGISLKLAERLAISIAENPELGKNIANIRELSKDLSKDPLTGLIIDKNEEPNANKDKDILLIVDSNRDVNNILEKTKTTKSIFIVGMKNKRDFDSTQKVLDRLFKVVEMYNTQEILFLLSPSIESELIMRVVKEEIVKSDLKTVPKLTRLSMGIPFGGSIEFSDERTIKEAMNKREEA
mgnify:CR=1 FL=1